MWLINEHSTERDKIVIKETVWSFRRSINNWTENYRKITIVSLGLTWNKRTEKNKYNDKWINRKDE